MYTKIKAKQCVNERNTFSSEHRASGNQSQAKIADNWLHETANSKQTIFTTSTPLTFISVLFQLWD